MKAADVVSGLKVRIERRSDRRAVTAGNYRFGAGQRRKVSLAYYDRFGDEPFQGRAGGELGHSMWDKRGCFQYAVVNRAITYEGRRAHHAFEEFAGKRIIVTGAAARPQICIRQTGWAWRSVVIAALGGALGAEAERKLAVNTIRAPLRRNRHFLRGVCRRQWRGKPENCDGIHGLVASTGWANNVGEHRGLSRNRPTCRTA